VAGFAVSVFDGDGGITRAQAAGLLIPGGVYRSAQRVGLPTAGGLNSAAAIAANTMYAWPIPIAAGVTLSGMALQVGTAVAGVSGKLGLALSGADGRPGTLVAEAPTPVDMNSAAAAELVASFSANQTVPAGIVWGLCVFNGLAQPVTLSAFQASNIFLGHFLGAASIQNYTLIGTAGPTIRLSRAHTYADAFPATLTGWTTATANAPPSSPVMVAVVA
jgi:hypothetical protein